MQRETRAASDEERNVANTHPLASAILSLSATGGWSAVGEAISGIVKDFARKVRARDRW
jgi:hypothetical protein